MRKGFTLVEIMIVVAIIAVLAAIAIPNLLRARVDANETNAKATLKTIASAAESYSLANSGNYPLGMDNLTTGNPPYLNQNYTNSTRHGYIFTCWFFPPAIPYLCTAMPTEINKTGTKWFKIQVGSNLTSHNF